MILYLYLYPLFMSHDLAVAIDPGANFKDWNDLIYFIILSFTTCPLCDAAIFKRKNSVI